MNDKESKMLEQFQNNDFSFESLTTLNDNLQYIDYLSGVGDNIKTIGIEPSLGYAYQGNFYGLLRELNISPNMYLFTLYVNGFQSPVDYDGELLVIKVPVRPPVPTN